MNKKVWFKILILGALVNLFAASAWACGESSDKTVKVYGTKSTDANGNTVCKDDKNNVVDCNTAGIVFQ